jgi:tetratricopeptide (TPR) repeat protein
LTAFEQVLDHTLGKGPAAEITPLINLGEINLTLERYEDAADYYRRATERGIAPGLRQVLAEAHRGTAEALVGLGRCAEAVPIAAQAVEVTRQYGFPIRLVVMVDTLALACRKAGRLGEAIDHLTEAVDLCRGQAGYPVAQVLNTLGETRRDNGDQVAARASHEEALDLAGIARNRKEQARAWVGLGDAEASLGNFDQARECWQKALDEYADMGLPAAARVAARLRDVRP